MPQCGCRGGLHQPPSLFPLYIHRGGGSAAGGASVPPCERTFTLDARAAAASPAKRARTRISITVEQGWHARVHELGTAVWESSAVVLRWLERHRALVDGRRVLELGAGPGLVAIACAALGASCVVCTDIDADVLSIARRNVARSVRDGVIEAGSVQVVEYGWGEGAAALSALSSSSTMEPFDLIIGADIMYLPDLYEEIAQDVRAMLRPRSGVALLVATLRGVALPMTLVERIVDSTEEGGAAAAAEEVVNVDGLGCATALVATWLDATPFVAASVETLPATWARWAPKGIAMCVVEWA